MKRLFAAIKIVPDAHFLQFYRAFMKQLQYDSIKWVEERNIHITTKFFGETGEERIPDIKRVLRLRSEQTPPLTLHFSKPGIFGSSYAPKVIWLGIEPYLELSTLMKQLHDDLHAIGYEPDRQNVVPHLTLGRVRNIVNKANFQNTLSSYRHLTLPGHTIAEMILYESILRPAGPEYRVLEKFPFIAAPASS